MKRKGILAAIVGIALLGGIGLLGACGHSHTFSSAWEHDANTHWHPAACDHDVRDGEATHDWDDGTVTLAATCVAKGEKTYSCKVCGETRKEDIPIAQDAHDWGTGTVTKAATCKEPGVRSFTCSYDSTHTKTEEIGIDDTAHSFSNRWSYNNDSHWKGATCGHSVRSEEAEHVWDSGTVLEDATCLKPGKKQFTCTVCNKTKEEEIDIDDAAHSYGDELESDENFHWYPATCGHSEVHGQEEAHQWDGGQVTKQPDCGVAGETTYTCTKCKRTKTVPIEPLEHTFSEQWAHDAEKHWHPATCAEHSAVDHTAVRKEESGHTFKDQVCTVCNYRLEQLLRFQTSTDGSYAIVTGFADGVEPSEVTDLVIPDTYGELPVYEIAAGALSEGTLSTGNVMRSISLPASLRKIGSYAFAGNDALDTVYWRGDLAGWLSLTASQTGGNPVGCGTGEHCVLYIDGALLTKIEIPASVTRIRDGAFLRCYLIQSVEIPSTVTVIGSNAFRYCSGITELTVQSGLTEIGSYAFGSCESLRDVSVPASVQKIGSGAFASCRSLEKLTLPFVGQTPSPASASASTLFGYIFEQKTTSLGKNVPEGYLEALQSFGKNSGNKRYAIVPTSLREVKITGGELKFGAFHGMKMLTKIEFPQTYTEIAARAFEGCENVESITMGDNVLVIGDGAFSGMKKLTSFDLGTKVEKIGVGAFASCPIEEITIPASVKEIGTNVSDSGLSGGVFAYNKVLKKVYISDLTAWCKIKFSSVSDNPISIASEWYLDGSPIENIVVPEGITRLGKYVFTTYAGIKSIKVGKDVEVIESNAFNKLSGFTLKFDDPNGWSYANVESSTKWTEIAAARLTGDLVGGDFVKEFNNKFLKKTAV